MLVASEGSMRKIRKLLFIYSARRSATKFTVQEQILVTRGRCEPVSFTSLFEFSMDMSIAHRNQWIMCRNFLSWREVFVFRAGLTAMT